MKLSHLCCLLLVWLPLTVAAQDSAYLDISITPFTPASIPTDQVTGADGARAITPEIRNAEARYLALYLRYRLEDSMKYGAVRVMAERDPGADLTIDGSVQESDGAVLALHLTVRDSGGAVWVDQDFRGTANPSTSLNADVLKDDDFAGLFSEILRALDTQLTSRTPEQLSAIKQQSLLRYGESLVPDYFASFFMQNADGSRSLVRLPAADDPLLTRINAIRDREYLFIDVVDEQYRRFFADVQPVYSMWRSLRREQMESAQRVTARENSAPSQFRRGSYFALQESYDNYRWAKLQELYLDELSTGFANETEPTQIELDDSLFRLTGTMAHQHREWRSILGELLALELRGE